MDWLYNFAPKNLERWSYALANARSGRARAKVLCIGDSTTAGGNGTTYAGGRANSYPTAMASALNAVGVKAEANSFFGDAHVVGCTFPQYDPRVTMGTGWGFYTASNGLGGHMFLNGTTTNALQFTPGASADTFDIYHLHNSSFSILVDGVSVATVTGTVGNDSPMKTTVSVASGLHTISIVPTSTTNPTYVIGINGYLSTDCPVSILSAGMGGSKASDWSDTANAWSPVYGMQTVAPDLALINLGINDANAGVSISAFNAAMQGIINAVGCDVVLVVPVPISTQFASAATQKSFRDAIYSLADSNNAPLIDLVKGIASGAASAAGFWYDGEHPTAAGYGAIGNAIADVVR